MVGMRGWLIWPRMNAYRLVIIAAALTTLVAAAMAAALAVFSGQALPQAVRHNLATASGTSVAVSGPVGTDQAAQVTATLPRQIGQALGGTPFTFYRARWSDPLGFAAGSPPARRRPGPARAEPCGSPRRRRFRTSPHIPF